MSSTSSDFPSPPHIVPAKFRGKGSFRALHNLPDKGSLDYQTGAALPPSRLPSTPSNQTHQCAGQGVHAPGAEKKASAWGFQSYMGDPWPRFMQQNLHDAYVLARPLPSLASHFSSYFSCGEDPTDPSHSDDIPSDSFSEGNSAVDGQGEEYDLESMDIRLRESYFEISAERGRWMSSPAVSSMRTQTFISSPDRVCSTHLCTHDLQTHTRRLSTNGVACSEISSTSFLEDNSASEDWDGSRCSSPLPSSSPPTSPMSFALSLPEDHLGIDDCDSVDQTPSLPSDGDQFSSEVVCAKPCDGTSHDESGPHTIAAHLPRYAELIQHEEDAQLLSAHLDVRCPTDCVRPVSGRRRSLSHERDVSVSTVNICQDELRQGVSSESERPGDQVASSRHVRLALPTPEPDERLPPTVKVEGDKFPEVPQTSQASTKRASAEPKLDCDMVRGISEWSGPVISRSNDAGPAPGDSEDRTIEQRTKRNARDSNLSLDRPKKKSKLLNCGGDGVGSQKHPTRKARTRAKSRNAESSPLFSGADELPDDHSAWSIITGVSSETVVLSPSQSRSQAPSRAALPPPQFPSECSTEEYTEITGILVEALATSRATSMDTAALYLVLTRAHPHLKTRHPKEEFLRLIGSVLETGRARCGMFEMVQSSGDANDEGHGRWFYVPEKDEDKERASLIRALMPRQKRSETMKYKQYYWKPLDRISRWDPEDAL